MAEVTVEVPELTRKNIAKRSRLQLERKVQSLEQKANIDPLTGLEGEYPLQDMINGLEARFEADYSKGEYLKGTFVIVDVDRLHDVNREFGEREGGDDYLRTTAEALKEAARGTGRCFRKEGADDFVLYIPGFRVRKEIDEKIDRVDEIMKEAEQKYQARYPGIQFGLSYTIATFHRAYGPRDAYKDAYHAMAEAKQSKTGERVGNVGRIYVNELTLEDHKYE